MPEHAEFQLATGPVTWGVDFADAPGNPPWSQVLDEIAASPLDALELGPVGYLPEDPETLRAALATRGLTAVGSFVFDAFHDPAALDGILDSARRACRAIAAAGGRVLVIIDRPGPERVATAGRGRAARRMDDGEWRGLVARIERVAAIAGDHGLVPAVHPHAGGYLEFEDEIDRLAVSTGLGLCLDSGHLAYSGADAAQVFSAYRDRLAHVHLKDIRPAVLDRVHAERLDFWAALEAGIFCPLGEGMVDLDGVLGALSAAGYTGFATIEQDRVPGAGSPADDLVASLRALRR